MKGRPSSGNLNLSRVDSWRSLNSDLEDEDSIARMRRRSRGDSLNRSPYALMGQDESTPSPRSGLSLGVTPSPTVTTPSAAELTLEAAQSVTPEEERYVESYSP